MKKVAIVGGGPRGIMAPWQDDTWDKWVLGNQMDRWNHGFVDRIFEIHENLSEHGDVRRYSQWLLDFEIPLVVSEKFMQQDDLIWHSAIDVFDKNGLPAGMSGQLSSSPAYMMAQAIMEGYDAIGLWGIDLGITDHEYFMQRPGMYAWIGYAMGIGVEVEIDPQSPLFHDGYDEGRDWGNMTWTAPTHEGESKFARPPFTEAQFKELSNRHADRERAAQAVYGATQSDQSVRDFYGHGGARQVYDKLAQVARAIESGQNIPNLIDSIVTK